MFHVKHLTPIFETLKTAQKFYLNQFSNCKMWKTCLKCGKVPFSHNSLFSKQMHFSKKNSS